LKPPTTLLILTQTNTAATIVYSLSSTLSRIPTSESCEVKAVAHNKIAIIFSHPSFDFFSHAAAAAAALPGTIHVELRAKVRPLNYHAAGGIQSGATDPVSAATPLWNAGKHCAIGTSSYLMSMPQQA
jgi:hypothetical protein